MRNLEFIALLTANTNKTSNLRTYHEIGKHWDMQTEKIPNSIANNIGRVIALIQAQVNQNLFCKKNEEYLLIYNLEVIPASRQNFYWSLAMAIKPIIQIAETTHIMGDNFQLVINGQTGEVMNPAKCLLEMELQTPEQSGWDSPKDAPASYGNYHAYRALCCFVAMTSYKPITEVADIFKGNYDTSEVMQHSKAFDSFIEARDFLAGKQDLGQYIVEIACAKEDVERLKQTGLGKEILLIINYLTKTISTATNVSLLSRYPAFNEELACFESLFVAQEHKAEVSDKTSILCS